MELSFISGILSLGLAWLASTVPAQGQATALTASTAAAAPPAVPYVEIARKVRQLSDHTETISRVQPPTLAKVPPPAPPPPLSADDLARQKRWAAKTNDTSIMTAVVHLGKQTRTELSWTLDGKTYHALSNVDFRLFSLAATLETDDMVISWYGFVSADDGEPDATTHAEALRQLAAKGAKPDYVFEGKAADLKANATALEALDYFHAAYQHQQAQLTADFNQRQADEQARQQLAAKTPPPSPVIRFWSDSGH